MKFEHLGEIVKIAKGKKHEPAPKKEGRNFRYIQIDDLRNDNNLKYTDEKGTEVNENDLIIAWDGANAGTIGFGLRGMIGSTLARLRIKDEKEYSTDFIGYLLRSQNKFLRSKTTGATIPHISKNALESIKIPQLDFPEQYNAALVLKKSEALIEQRKQSIALLDEYLKNTFAAMFIDKGFPYQKLGDLSNKITDGEHKKPDYQKTGMPFISVKNITNGFLDFTDCKYVTQEDFVKFTKRCKPELGDIIYTKVGATYGRATLVNTEIPFCLYVSVALIKPKKEIVLPKFLQYSMNHPFIKRQADKSIKGAGVPDLHLIEIKSFEIPVPPIELQNKFADIVTKAEVLKEDYKSSLIELENLYGSLSQRAFRGELEFSKPITS
jgi:type I restriction enzyme S subunit